jgi:hypothetical protein
MFQRPALTRHRIWLAYAISLTADLCQLLLGPLGWVGGDEVIDIAAMLLIWLVIGFHPLLLPTFVIEFLPLADMLPTWTGCVAMVIMLRQKQQAAVPPPADPGPFIDV